MFLGDKVYGKYKCMRTLIKVKLQDKLFVVIKHLNAFCIIMLCSAKIWTLN